MSKTFEVIRPKSLLDSAYEDYEYLIRWIGRDGSDYIYMFYDAEIRHNVDSEPINEDDVDNIRSLVKSVGEKVTLTANDLSLSDLNIIKQILENPILRRIKKDDTEERFAPDRNSFNYRLKDGRYELEFDIVKANTKTWR